MSHLQGIDVSIWQNEVDWTKVAASSHRDFAYIKVSERNFKDKWFDANWRNAKDLVPRGGYLFFRPDNTVKDQIDFFCDLLQYDVGELRPSLDVEDTGNLQPGALAEKVLFALKHIEERLKVRPIIYTSARFWNENIQVSLPWTKGYALWIAQYNLKIQNPSKLPLGFEDWDIWQYYDRGIIEGVTGKKASGVLVNRVDLNYMKRERADRIFIKEIPVQDTLENRVARIEKILVEKGWL